MRYLIIGLLGFCIAACSSSPSITYHMIESLPMSDGIHTQDGPVMGVERLNLPSYLETQAISYRRDDSRVIVKSLERWSEPVSTALSRVIIANLATALPDYRIIGQPWSQQTQPSLRLTVRIHQFEAVNDAVVLTADWQVRATDAAPGPAHQGVFKITLDDVDAETIAAAYSQALAELSQAIAADAQSLDMP